MTHSIWHIGQLLNSVQSSFVGLLRVWSIPLVLLLSLASGFTTYYGLSHFITDWIALIITVAVQSIMVICTLELASARWRANLGRFVTIVVTLFVSVFVSVSFSYFKFYEFSQQDILLLERQQGLEKEINGYLNDLNRLKGELSARQQQRLEKAAKEESQAFVGAHPNIQGEYRNKVGYGQFWRYYHEAHLAEQAKWKGLQSELAQLDGRISAVLSALQGLAQQLEDPATYDRLLVTVNTARAEADRLATTHGQPPVTAPRVPSFAEFSQGITPSFAMWENISLFALACAAMVDFFTLVLSYRLEFNAPGPLDDKERKLAYEGIQEFSEFTINRNDELEFVVEKTELERARRYPDWRRMFVVSFLLNRGFLRKVDERSVEFAPNLYPIIAERLTDGQEAEAGGEKHDVRLYELAERKRHG